MQVISLYQEVINRLMANDPNAGWCDIIHECDGDERKAVVVLARDLRAAVNQNQVFRELASFYRAQLQSITNP
jgi:hypothetical protein